MVVVAVAFGKNVNGFTPVVGATVPDWLVVKTAAWKYVPLANVGVEDNSRTYWIWSGMLTTADFTENVVPTDPLICELFVGDTSVGMFKGVAYPLLGEG